MLSQTQQTINLSSSQIASNWNERVNEVLEMQARSKCSLLFKLPSQTLLRSEKSTEQNVKQS